MLLARRFTLRAELGISGALLAVPILRLKIVSDRVEPLNPIGRLIGS